MNKLKLVFIFISIAQTTLCQDWQRVVNSIDNGVKYLYVDTTTNLLYASGLFHNINGINANEIASWDGVNWDSVGHGSTMGAPINCMINYKGDLFANGAFVPDFTYKLGRWTGTYWDTTGLQFNGAVCSFKELNGDLYCGGVFNTVGYMQAIDVAKYNGTSWTAFNNTGWVSGCTVEAMEIYNGELYCAGNIVNLSTGMYKLTKLVGNDFPPFDSTSFHSISDNILALKTYRNDLYIGGYFLTGSGNFGNYLLKWDGTTLSQAGTGINAAIRCMKVYKDELYVSGDFTTIGGVAANGLAKFNGTTWSAISSSVFDGPIYDMEFYHDQLYVSGNFMNIDTMNIKWIARYAHPLGINENESVINFFVNPNPSHEKLFITTNTAEKHQLKIFDVLGKELFSKTFQSSKEEINISTFSNGIYFLQLISDKGSTVKKFIKN